MQLFSVADGKSVNKYLSALELYIIYKRLTKFQIISLKTNEIRKNWQTNRNFNLTLMFLCKKMQFYSVSSGNFINKYLQVL